ARIRDRGAGGSSLIMPAPPRKAYPLGDRSSMSALDIKIILGSTRANRFGDKPTQWILDLAARRSDMRVELLDLREYALPFFEEPLPPGFAKDNYTNPAVIRWREKIREADGFIICSPEYNHGYPAVL